MSESETAPAAVTKQPATPYMPPREDLPNGKDHPAPPSELQMPVVKGRTLGMQNVSDSAFGEMLNGRESDLGDAAPPAPAPATPTPYKRIEIHGAQSALSELPPVAVGSRPISTEHLGDGVHFDGKGGATVDAGDAAPALGGAEALPTATVETPPDVTPKLNPTSVKPEIAVEHPVDPKATAAVETGGKAGKAEAAAGGFAKRFESARAGVKNLIDRGGVQLADGYAKNPWKQVGSVGLGLVLEGDGLRHILFRSGKSNDGQGERHALLGGAEMAAGAGALYALALRGGPKGVGVGV